MIGDYAPPSMVALPTLRRFTMPRILQRRQIRQPASKPILLSASSHYCAADMTLFSRCAARRWRLLAGHGLSVTDSTVRGAYAAFQPATASRRAPRLSPPEPIFSQARQHTEGRLPLAGAAAAMTLSMRFRRAGQRRSRVAQRALPQCFYRWPASH